MSLITLLGASLLSGTFIGPARSEESYSTNDFQDADLYAVFVSAMRDLASCRSLTLCQLVENFRNGYSSTASREYHHGDQTSTRSYMSGYGPPAAPAYYPAFDPISVLASLAFLAFLLQSFASLFDRSRSIIPTIVNSRQSSELKVQDVAKRVLRALDEYGQPNGISPEENKNHKA